MRAHEPPDEAVRLDTLHAYAVLDTDAERDFDDLTLIAAQICGTPIALISLVDADRQWFKAKVGLDVSETPRELAFCAHTILDTKVLIVPDATRDERFADNALVMSDPNIRFYAGAPLIAPTGHALGTLCVIGLEPRGLDPDQERALEALSRQVISQLELRRAAREQRHIAEEMHELSGAVLAADRAKSEFLARMSHELRTPLNAVIGFADGLLSRTDRHPLNDHQIDRIERMKAAGMHLLTHVEDILDLAKVEAGKMPIRSEDVSPAAIARDVGVIAEGLVANTAEAVRFAVEVEGDLPRFRSDARRIVQIVVNLVSNAVKSGTDLVTLEVRRHERGVRFAVIDAGCGIAADDLETIFEPFRQVGDVHRQGSTGIGLPLCRNLARLLGAELTVESVLGGGSTFSVVIPAAYHAAGDDGAALAA